MKSTWMLFVAAGLVVGVATGFEASARFHRLPKPTGSALLRGLSLAEIGTNTACTNWEVMEDRIYEQFPALSRSPLVARRVVARAEMSEVQLGRFVTLLQAEIRRMFDVHGAINEAFYDVTKDGSKIIDGVSVHSRVHVPRWFYRIREIHGVADFWYVAESGRVTLIISMIEGP